jgi:toxin secretion/phage lysis holin
MDLDRLKPWLGAAVAAAAALWASLPATVIALLGLMALDVATGLVAGWAAGALDSAVGWRGLARKLATVLAILAVGIMQRAFGDAIPAAEAVAGFYCAIEALSIVENLARAGVPVPAPLRAALAALDQQRREEPPEPPEPRR